MTNGSLQYVLLRRLLLYANVAILLLLPVIFELFKTYAVDAYDNELAESAFSLVPYLVKEGGIAKFSMPSEAEQAFRTDQQNRNYYLVLGPKETYLAGDRDLPVGVRESSWRKLPPSVFYDASYHGIGVRVNALRHVMDGQTYLLLAAETTDKRERIKLKILLGLIAPLFVLSVVNGLAIWHGIRLALLPVEEVRVALQKMQQGRLRPLSEVSVPTEIKPLVQEFNALLSRLESSAYAQERFVADAAHQLRTPLAGVRTQLESIRDETVDNDQRARMNRCVEAISRMGHLVHQMLALLTAGSEARGVATHSIADVEAVIRDRSTDWVGAASLKNIDLGFELGPLVLRGDATLIGEMIGNLVDNALTHTPHSSTVTVRCGSGGGAGFIEVEDDGPGIPEAERGRVFERFYRLAGAAPSGSGLGLAIVGDIVRGLNGRVMIQTPLQGAGCLVRIDLPALIDP